jgi:hypothetical protein
MSVSKFAFRVGPRGGNFLLGDAPAVTAQVLYMQFSGFFCLLKVKMLSGGWLVSGACLRCLPAVLPVLWMNGLCESERGATLPPPPTHTHAPNSFACEACAVDQSVDTQQRFES